LICEDCGLETADAPFCIRCGHRQQEPVPSASRRRYSADPDESALSVHVISTLFPRLPRDDLAAFRVILLLGVGAVVTLAVLGLYPIAVLAAAALAYGARRGLVRPRGRSSRMRADRAERAEPPEA